MQTLDPEISCRVENGKLMIGGTEASVFEPESRGKVPETLFYDTPQNLTLMEAMLQDFLLGEHMLLVGNQVISTNQNSFFELNYNDKFRIL